MTAPGAERPLVVVTRPEPEAAALAERLEQGGYRALVAPMLAVVRAERLRPEDLVGAPTVVLTSARAAAAAGEDLGAAALAGLTAACVGSATAAAAQAAGFGATRSAEGDAADLSAMLGAPPAGAGAVLILRGRDAAFDLSSVLAARGWAVRTRVLYRAEAVKGLRREAVDAFVEKRAAAVLLLSERTARRFVEVIGGTGKDVDLGPTAAVCISEKVAAAARPARFGRSLVAERPDLGATLRALDGILGGWAGQTESLC